MLPGVGPVRLEPPLRRGGERRHLSIGRIHNEGGPEVRRTLGIGIPPEIVIGSNLARGERAFARSPAKNFRFVRGGFRRGENLLALQILGALQGDDRGVAPYALEIWLTLRGSRRSPRLVSGRRFAF